MPSPPIIARTGRSPLETTLHRCPGVRDVALMRSHSEEFVFVVPDDRYLDDVLGRADAENRRLQTWRKTYDLMQLGKNALSAPVAFNTAGWNSSYTREPIPAAEMREWVDHTVNNILSLGPREVLEIGCGPGLLLLRVAPRCTRYWATDFASEALKSLRSQMGALGGAWEGVKLFERSAENLDGFIEESFDTVVINSVVQHFPSLGYLNRVLDGVVRLVKPGGHILVGDSRSLPLLPMYNVSVELHHAKPDERARDILKRMRRRTEFEEQLVLSPAYFVSLFQHPRVSSVVVRPKRGLMNNELNRYRFDVFLSVGKPQQAETPEWISWKEYEWPMARIRSLLTDGDKNIVAFSGIRNSRLEDDMQALVELKNEELPIRDVRERTAHAVHYGLDPELLWRMGAETGYETRISWNSCRSDGSFDVVFSRSRIPEGAIDWPRVASRDVVRVANWPGQIDVQRKLVDQLRAVVASERAQVVLVDTIPVRPDGRVDEAALLANIR